MPKFRTAMPIAELREKNRASKRAAAVEKRREQEGTDKAPPKPSGN